MMGIGLGMIKQLLTISMAIAGLIALMTIADLAIGIPFSRASIVMDVMFLLSAGIVIYMGIDSYKDLR
jgi:hypothetical protein